MLHPIKDQDGPVPIGATFRVTIRSRRGGCVYLGTIRAPDEGPLELWYTPVEQPQVRHGSGWYFPAYGLRGPAALAAYLRTFDGMPAENITSLDADVVWPEAHSAQERERKMFG